MKKKLLGMMLAVTMAGCMLTGCGVGGEDVAEPAAEQTTADKTETVNENAETETVNDDAEDETASAADADDANGEDTEAQTTQTFDTKIRLGGLKGPTTMGLAKLLSDASSGDSAFQVDFTLAAAADELTPKLIQGEMDLAAVPCNLASVLYNKTEGGIQMLCVNTLGVLSIVDTGDSVQSIADLKGKTIYATGQGTTPEFSLKYILKENGIDPEKDVSFEWKSEATEVVSAMSGAEDEVIAMLPQPFVTVAMTQVEGLRIAVNLNDAWNALENGSSLVTGVLVARKAFVEENKALVDAFLDSYSASCEYANTNTEETAALIEELDIVKAPIAQKAIPNCNITYLEGDAMRRAAGGYLQILHGMEPKSVGGSLPEDGFYYVR